MNWHPTFKCFVDSGLAQNALEIQPHPKEVADLDDEQIKKVKDRFKEQPKKYDLDKMAKKIADLEQNLKAVKLKGTPEQYRKLQDELEKFSRQYQSVYKNEPKISQNWTQWALDKQFKTRFKELNYCKIPPNQWSFVSTETNQPIGMRYASKVELLADLDRFAREYGL